MFEKCMSIDPVLLSPLCIVCLAKHWTLFFFVCFGGGGAGDEGEGKKYVLFVPLLVCGTRRCFDLHLTLISISFFNKFLKHVTLS